MYFIGMSCGDRKPTIPTAMLGSQERNSAFSWSKQWGRRLFPLTSTRTWLGEMVLHPSCRWRRWSSEKSSGLSGVTQVFNGRVKPRPQGCSLPAPFSAPWRHRVRDGSFSHRRRSWLSGADDALGSSPSIFSPAPAPASVLPVSHDWNLKACNC